MSQIRAVCTKHNVTLIGELHLIPTLTEGQYEPDYNDMFCPEDESFSVPQARFQYCGTEWDVVIIPDQYGREFNANATIPQGVHQCTNG